MLTDSAWLRRPADQGFLMHFILSSGDAQRFERVETALKEAMGVECRGSHMPCHSHCPFYVA